jgi:Fe-S-cluster containining protein
MTAHADTPLANPCATCGVCCSAYLVPLVGYDFWRICRSQSLPPEEFAVAVESNEESRGDGFRLEPGGKLHFLVLDKRGPRKLHSPCVFLLQLGGGRVRCGIYPDRPTACRTYPIVHDRGRIGFRPKRLCPPDAWKDAAPRLAGWLADQRRQDLLFDVYFEVTNRWNARVHAAPAGTTLSVGEYFAYVIAVYDRLARLDDELGPAHLRRVVETWCNAPEGVVEIGALRGREEYPWVDYLYRAREVVDRFYPEIPPLAMHESVLDTVTADARAN